MTSRAAAAAKVDETAPLGERNNKQQQNAGDSRTTIPAPDDTRRLIFLGEALRVSDEYCGLGQELAIGSPEILDLFSAAYDRMVTAHPDCSREDFALYATSHLAQWYEESDRYDIVRQGALRYLEENQAKLLRSIAALREPSRENASRDPVVSRLPAGRVTVSEDFIRAFESLKPNLTPHERQEPRLQAEKDEPIEAELMTIRARRHASVRQIRARSMSRHAVLLTVLFVSGAVVYAFLDLAVAAGL